MAVTIEVKTQADFVKFFDINGNEITNLPNTVILQFNGMSENFDARDLDQYLEKYLGNFIRRDGIANGINMCGNEAVIGYATGTNLNTVKNQLRTMFDLNLKQVREDIGRL